MDAPRALEALEKIRDIERRENRKRIESQSRLLLRDIEVANARHEAERLRRQSREWAERAQAATEAALRDALTGLPNRRALDEQLGERLRAPADRKHFAAALIDIDLLEAINDSRGHEAGDHVLRELAQLLDATMRRGDIAFRMGGEEFVLLINAPTLSQAEAACERVRLRVERHDWLAAQRADAGQPSLDGSVTVSIGVTTVARDDDAASLLRRADQALYHAKHLGRNRVEAG